jgi:hypothetical protein
MVLFPQRLRVGIVRRAVLMIQDLLKWTADTDVPTARPRIFSALETLQYAWLEPVNVHMSVQAVIGSECPLWSSQRCGHPPIFCNAGVFEVRPDVIREWLMAKTKSIDHCTLDTFF